MTNIKSLNDVKPGDVIAFRPYGHYQKWKEVTVEEVTPKFILLRHPAIRFKKENGLSKGENPDRISVITAEIQEEWDQKEYTEQIHKLIDSKPVPAKTLKKVIEILTKSLTK